MTPHAAGRSHTIGDGGIIDTHVHVVSANTARYARQINASATHRWWSRGNCDRAALRANMDAQGVAAALAVQAVGVYGYDNAYLLDEVASVSASASVSERILAIVAVDMDADRPAEEIARLSSLPGVAGVRLFAVAPGSSWVHRAKADEALQAAAEADLPVVLTAFEHQLPPLVPSITRHSALRLAIDHCAFPTLDGARIHRGSPLLALTGASHVRVKVSSHLLLEVAPPHAPSGLIDDLVSCFGSDRVMWGSDWPQTPLPDYAAHLELARRAAVHLQPAERHQFMGANAAAWLGSRFVNRVDEARDAAAPGRGGER